MLAAPLGIVGGYLLTWVMNKKYSWEWSFYIQGLGLIPCFVFIVLMPAKYLNITIANEAKNKIKKDVEI